MIVKKKTILTLVLAGFLGLVQAQNNSTTTEHVKSATQLRENHAF